MTCALMCTTFYSRFALRDYELDDERDDIISQTSEGHGVLV